MAEWVRALRLLPSLVLIMVFIWIMLRDLRTGSFFVTMSVILLVSGCAGVKPHSVEYGDGEEAPVASETESGASPPMSPRWMTTGDALGVQSDAAREGSTTVQLSTDPATLRNQLAARCTEGIAGKEEGFLPVLITEIYRIGIDPALATEALLKANCGSLSEVVQGMVAEGGESAVAPVAERALFLAGPGAEGIIESAATSGLGRDLSGLSRSRAGGGRDSLTYSLVYFPARSRQDDERGLGSPYSTGMPDYGIYTFILLGEGYAGVNVNDQERYGELLRVVQSYVLAAGDGALGPESVRHAFLIPVHSQGRGKPLVDQTDPALSANMRDALAKYFDQTKRPRLASRLREHPGPFLISSLEPRLVPGNTRAPRLLTDLSEMAPEYMYAVVDAYDRRIPAEMAGSAASFQPIRERLVELFALVDATGANARVDDQSWVTLTGATASRLEPDDNPSN